MCVCVGEEGYPRMLQYELCTPFRKLLDDLSSLMIQISRFLVTVRCVVKHDWSCSCVSVCDCSLHTYCLTDGSKWELGYQVCSLTFTPY